MTSKKNDKIVFRCDQCFNLGMMFNGSAYVGTRHYNKDFNISVVELQCDTDEVWDEKIANIKATLEKRIAEES
jgi:hypothetical protein